MRSRVFTIVGLIYHATCVVNEANLCLRSPALHSCLWLGIAKKAVRSKCDAFRVQSELTLGAAPNGQDMLSILPCVHGPHEGRM